MKNKLITSTTSEVPGKKVTEIIGIVEGNTIRARDFVKDIGAGLKSLIGGEIKSYTEMTSLARKEAFNRMINEAIRLKADAVINVRFTTSMVMQGASEMLAYGTAVKLK